MSTLQTNLVSYWPLASTADSKGSNTLTNNNVVTFVSGILGNNANFVAASSQSLSRADNATLSITGDISMEFWVKLASQPSASSMNIQSKWNTAGNQRSYQFTYNDNAGTKYLEFRYTSDGAATSTIFQANQTLTTGTFYHIVVTATVATPVVTIYVNGVALSGTLIDNSAHAIFDSTATFYIGTLNDASQYFNGVIGQFGIWSRVLSAGDVTSLYNSGTGDQYPLVPLYWVGGTGSWDASTTTHWSDTSGGSGGIAVPGTTTDVFFDASSGGGTTTLTADTTIPSITFTGYTGTFAGSNALNLSTNLVLGSGMTITYTGLLTFTATATGKTITSNGKTLLSVIVFNGVGGGWTLQDTFVTTGASVTLTNGSLNLGNQNMAVPIFSSANQNVRILTMGSGTITLSGTGTVWDLSVSYLMTLTPNTSTIKLSDTSSSAKTFSGGSLIYNNLYITGAGTGTYTIVGNNTFNDFKADTPPHTINFTAGSRQSLQTFTVNGTAGNLMTLQSTVSGSAWYMSKITTGSISCDYLSLKDSHVS